MTKVGALGREFSIAVRGSDVIITVHCAAPQKATEFLNAVRDVSQRFINEGREDDFRLTFRGVPVSIERMDN